MAFNILAQVRPEEEQTRLVRLKKNLDLALGPLYEGCAISPADRIARTWLVSWTPESTHESSKLLKTLNKQP